MTWLQEKLTHILAPGVKVESEKQDQIEVYAKRNGSLAVDLESLRRSGAVQAQIEELKKGA
ncbi:hypothetical protein [Pseudoalteromonas luteoviolacea]|uniref:hypothetical protein n=1 Tax=Pseudoalteromonas luteoviolacea TaxID=43657 RepID=UPI00114DBCD6|nr:hypothetical protein [Pseudoalteromonas luteoviolacea]TQF69557.1 hypothetical protein FLM44_00115 [Pseudoalteromonas luteoviolacea]